jgi:hypothetical protein
MMTLFCPFCSVNGIIHAARSHEIHVEVRALQHPQQVRTHFR